MDQYFNDRQSGSGHDDTDRDLRRLFAESAVTLDGAVFEREFLVRLTKVQRRQWMRRALILSLLSTMVVLLTLPLLHAITNIGQFLVTPIGWGCSLLASAWILIKARVVRRS